VTASGREGNDLPDRTRLQKERWPRNGLTSTTFNDARKLAATFPRAVYFNESNVILGLNDLSAKHILSAVKAGVWRDGIAWTCACNTGATHLGKHQYEDSHQSDHGRRTST
jgi:hypothetical protein